MKRKLDTLQPRILRLAHIHFFYILSFAASIIIYDASHLITPHAVLLRWEVAAAMTLAVTAVWYLAHNKNNPTLQKRLVATLVVADIAFASFLVYADRGMAGLAVALYAVPITVSAALFNRNAVLATAALCTVAYALATIKYFVDYFNEGYKVQLYSTIGFYGAAFFILGLLLVVIIQRKTKT